MIYVVMRSGRPYFASTDLQKATARIAMVLENVAKDPCEPPADWQLSIMPVETEESRFGPR